VRSQYVVYTCEPRANWSGTEPFLSSRPASSGIAKFRSRCLPQSAQTCLGSIPPDPSCFPGHGNGIGAHFQARLGRTFGDDGSARCREAQSSAGLRCLPSATRAGLGREGDRTCSRTGAARRARGRTVPSLCVVPGPSQAVWSIWRSAAGETCSGCTVIRMRFETSSGRAISVNAHSRGKTWCASSMTNQCGQPIGGATWIFRTPVSLDNAYAATLIRCTLNRRSLPHY
jgi:hypothetical protein